MSLDLVRCGGRERGLTASWATHNRPALALALAAGLWLAASGGPGLLAQTPADAAAGVSLGKSPGVCVVLGDREGRRAIELAKSEGWTVYVPLSEAAQADAARKAADAAGLLGVWIFVEQGPAGRIGLADNVADAVLGADAAGADKAEVLRVLRPAGKATIGSDTWEKPLPEGIDEWSHHYHGPDNNPQSLDRVAKGPYLTQFVVEPRYAPAPQAAVSSGGRVFMAFGHVAWHQREEPVLNTLWAINGYNGTMLWRRPLTPGIMVDRSTMIATPKHLYLADEKSCKVLDASTGSVTREITAPADVCGGTFWKWMAMEGGVLYAMVGPQEPRDPDAKWRSTNHGWPWDAISKGYNENDYRWGFSHTLVALDPADGRVLWSHKEEQPMDTRLTALKNGRLYIGHFGRYLACLDAKNGEPIWRRTAEKDVEIFATIGPYRPGHGYVGGWKSTIDLKCTDKALYICGPQVEWLTALSADDGRVLFKHPAKDLQVVVRDDGVYVIGPQGSNDQTKKLDLLSGKVLASFAGSRRACTRSTGTCDAIFFRGHEGSGRLDLATGNTQWISPMRPSCHVGVVVAGGLLYWAPWTCDCTLQMFGSIAMGPAGDFRFEQPAEDADRLDTVAAASETSLKTASGDWPTFQADVRRTAKSAVAVPTNVEVLWKASGHAALESSAPTAAGGLVFVAGFDGAVRARNAATGKLAWTAYTGGPVRYPPTIADGRALVGSDDGHVYCFDAATGKTLWRFRAAPAYRRIPIYRTLVSTWPVAGGVLVDRGVAYFAAGINDLDGTHVYAVDVATGKIRWQNNTCGHLDAVSQRGVECQGTMLLAGDKLYLAGGNTVSPGVFDVATGKCLNSPPGGMGSSAPRGRELHLAPNGAVMVTGQPLYSQPGATVFDQSVRWRDVVVRAGNAQIAYTRNRNADASWTLTAKQGNQSLWTQPLSAEPVRWGIAVDAQGRVIVVQRDGQVLCLAAK